MVKKSFKLKSLHYGKTETITFLNKTMETAVRKKTMEEPIFLSKLGLIGDEQADKRFHGGEDRALCQYPYDYYPYWDDLFSHTDGTSRFGENLTTLGMTEDNTHIGDIFTFGEAVIQVSEPREPCSTIAARYGIPDLVKRMVTTGYTGFMFRVLKEGMVRVQDEIVLVEPHPMLVSVSFVNDFMYHDRKNKEKREKVLAVDALSVAFRAQIL